MLGRGENVYFAEIVWKWNFSGAVLLIYLLFWKHIFREAGGRQTSNGLNIITSALTGAWERQSFTSLYS